MLNTIKYVAQETFTSRKSRRVYRYKGANLVCFRGYRFVGGSDSQISHEHPVTKIEIVEGKEGATVTQRLPKRKGVTETWAVLVNE